MHRINGNHKGAKIVAMFGIAGLIIYAYGPCRNLARRALSREA